MHISVGSQISYILIILIVFNVAMSTISIVTHSCCRGYVINVTACTHGMRRFPKIRQNFVWWYVIIM